MSGKPFIDLDSELINRLYIEQRLTARQIAAQLGTSPKTILRRLQSFGASIRHPGPERHEKLRDQQWMQTQYVTNWKPLQAIAAEVGASPAVVRAWLKAHSIERRPRGQNAGKVFGEDVRKNMSAAKKGRLTGEQNPNWRGGLVNPNQRLRTSHEAKAWSLAVRERDGFKCVECGATGRLHAHHMKPWKSSPELRFDVANGKTLCPPCHSKAHGWKFPDWAYHGNLRTSAKHSAQE